MNSRILILNCRKTEWTKSIYRLKCHQNAIIKLSRTFASSSHASQKFYQRPNPSNSILFSKQYQKDIKSLFSSNDKRILKDFLRLLSDNKREFDEKNFERLNKESSEGESNKQDKPKDPNEELKKKIDRAVSIIFTSVLIYLTISLLTGEQGADHKGEEKFISWNEFVNLMLSKGEVQEIVINKEAELAYIKLYPGAIIKGHRSDRPFYMLKIAHDFEEKLRKAEDELHIRSDQRVNVRYTSAEYLPYVLSIMLSLFIIKLLFNMSMKNVKSSVKGPMDLFSSFTKARFTMVDPKLQANVPKVSFKDVAGLREAKIEVMEFVEYIKRPEKFKALGAKVPKGALLLGPPGCGKTLLAKALANEAGVPFFSMAGTEFIEMIGGVGAARVRDLFAEARKQAPSIIFIDEIDTVGKKRSSGNDATSSSEMDQTLNQLLSEMDGIETRENIIVLASTNRADVLDKALLRPGRFDRHITIDLPTYEERKEILNVYLSKLKLAKDLNERFVSDLAHLTPRMSGADLANICNEAALFAAREAKSEIDRKCFDAALERVISGAEKKNSSIMKDEQKLIAYHECGHVLLSWLLADCDLLYKVSLVQRTKALTLTHYLPQDRKLYSYEELFDQMCLHFGGRVAESLVFNRYTTNSEKDLKTITKIAYAIVQAFGMSDRVGQVSFPTWDEEYRSGAVGKKPYSKKLHHLIDQEASKIISQAHLRSQEIMKQNIDKLHTLAELLLKKETLEYNEIKELIGAPVNESKKVKFDFKENFEKK